MSPRWVKGAQRSLDNVRLAGAANQSQRSQSGTLNTQYPWSWTRGWRMKNRAGREAAEITTGEVGVGLKRWKVQRVTSQRRWPLEQSCHIDHTSRLGNYQHPCFFFFLHLLLFLQRSPLAKRHKLQTGHDCDTYVITCWAVSLPAWLAHPRAPSLPPGKETAEIRQSEGGKCLVVECFNIMAWLCSSRSDRFICMREKRQAASCWLWSAGQNSQTEKILPLKTTSELWLSQLVSRPNALVIILLTAVMDRKRRKKTW